MAVSYRVMLFEYLASNNVDVEIIDYVPSTYRNDRIYCRTGLERGHDLERIRRIRTKRKFNRDYQEI